MSSLSYIFVSNGVNGLYNRCFHSRKCSGNDTGQNQDNPVSYTHLARVQKLPLAESDRLAKLVPDKIPDKKLNLKNAIEYVPELQAAEHLPILW